jgi:hypothetical protein
VARAVLERAGLAVDHYFGFNLLPLFKPVFGPLLRALDGAGKIAVPAYVNFAISGRKR